MAAKTPHSYSASKQELLGRMRRISGQIEGIARMIEDDRYCIDVMTQISAVDAALDKVALGLVDGHVRKCMAEGGNGLEQTDELMAAVGRLLRAR